MIVIRFWDDNQDATLHADVDHFNFFLSLWKKAHDTNVNLEATPDSTEQIPVYKIPKALAHLPQMSSGSDAKQTLEVPCIRVTALNADTGKVESEWIIIKDLTLEIETELMESMYFGHS